MVVAVANARQAVTAPVRQARRFGLLSVAQVVDGEDQHWMLGGLTAEGELCSKPTNGTINCGPSAAKTDGSWYADITGDPWLTYMYEKCRTVGRFDSAASKVRARFLSAEQSAVERGFATNVLAGAASLGALPTVGQAIGRLEAEAGQEYGAQITLHIPFQSAEEAAGKGLFERVGDHLETAAGSLVSIGNYTTSVATPTLWATGSVVLQRSNLTEVGPVHTPQNEYFSIVERAYAALVDCFFASATATLCGC